MIVKNLKQFLIICLLIPFNLLSKNRIATSADKRIYGEYISHGDLIIDTPTKIKQEGNEVIYYFMERQWPTLREGATIWIDGEKLGFVSVIKFSNTSSPLNPWHIHSASVRNIPNTKVVTQAFFCQGLKHFELNGESADFPGLSEWPASRKFLTGSFGFHVIAKMFGGHGYHIAVLDGGTIRMKGFEAQHGFSAVRLNGGDYDITIEEVEISNFYIHDTGDGEGMYLGATHDPPFAKLKNLKISHGIITRTAAEALQVQHLAGGADIHHITIRSANVRWMNEFMKGQDSGIQWNIDKGINKLHHIIVDGFASVGFVPFGNPGNEKGSISYVSDVLFNNGIDTGIYLHKSGSFGVEWQFENIFYRSFDDGCYYQSTGRPERNFIVSSRNGTDKYIFKNIVHDGSKKTIFQDSLKSAINTNEATSSNLPAPEYINSGFREPANRIRQWYQYYGKYFPASQGGKFMIATDWQVGDIAIETIGEYGFFKCIQAHTSTAERPGTSKNFIKLTWDENGIRNDQEGWNSFAKQSNFPPDDLRLREGNYWKDRNYGFSENQILGRKGE